MQAAWYEKNGAAREVLIVGEKPQTTPGPGEVRVRLRASGVNPSDVKTRAGSRPMSSPWVIPGSDGAGFIDSVGEGISPARIGERVWTHNAAWQRNSGTSAQFVTVPARLARPLPRALDEAQGACLGIPVMTAHRCVFADGPVAGRTVLVRGGAGVVGHYAVQWAKWGGARVLATVSSPAKAAHAMAGGADHVIDYRREDVAAQVAELTSGQGVDCIVEVDFADNLLADIALLKTGGVIAAYGSREPEVALPYRAANARNIVIRTILVYTMPDAAIDAAVADIGRWVASGTAQFAVAARFALRDVVAAHEAVEGAAKIGHVVLDIP